MSYISQSIYDLLFIRKYGIIQLKYIEGETTLYMSLFFMGGYYAKKGRIY